jgi:flagellar biosynthesis/type III secretory pathway protein FliH
MSSPEPSAPVPWATPPEPGPTSPWGPPELGAGSLSADAASIAQDPTLEAYRRGYQAGLEEGFARADGSLEPARRALAALVAAIEREQATIRSAAEENIAALSLAVARWLFQREVTIDAATLRALIRRGLALLPPGAPIEVRAHPADLELLGGQLDLNEPDGRPIALHWSTDPMLDRGSFTLASPERLVDGRTDIALRNLYAQIVGA